VSQEKAMRIDLMKHLVLILTASFCCCSCSEKSNDPGAKDTSVANSPSARSESNSPKTGENVLISTTNGKAADLSQAWFYTTNGNSIFKTFTEITNGQVISSKTVDDAGKLRWRDEFSYSQDSKSPIEMRRIKPDGKVFRVLYNYSADGHQTSMVIGPDGKPVPAESQDSVLAE
jgi:hypothetical protein